MNDSDLLRLGTAVYGPDWTPQPGDPMTVSSLVDMVVLTLAAADGFAAAYWSAGRGRTRALARAAIEYKEGRPQG